MVCWQYNGDIMLPATDIKYALHAHMQRSMDLHRYLSATKIDAAPLTSLPSFMLKNTHVRPERAG